MRAFSQQEPELQMLIERAEGVEIRSLECLNDGIKVEPNRWLRY